MTSRVASIATVNRLKAMDKWPVSSLAAALGVSCSSVAKVELANPTAMPTTEDADAGPSTTEDSGTTSQTAPGG